MIHSEVFVGHLMEDATPSTWSVANDCGIPGKAKVLVAGANPKVIHAYNPFGETIKAVTDEGDPKLVSISQDADCGAWWIHADLLYLSN